MSVLFLSTQWLGLCNYLQKHLQKAWNWFVEIGVERISRGLILNIYTRNIDLVPLDMGDERANFNGYFAQLEHLVVVSLYEKKRMCFGVPDGFGNHNNFEWKSEVEAQFRNTVI